MNALERLHAPIALKTKAKESPLVRVEDISIQYAGEIITYGSLNLYGSDVRGNGIDEPRRSIDVRRVTIGMLGEELETDNEAIADWLVSYHYENT